MTPKDNSRKDGIDRPTPRRLPGELFALSLNYMPDEIKLMIVGNLSFNEVLHFTPNHQWVDFGKDKSLWKRFHEQLSKQDEAGEKEKPKKKEKEEYKELVYREEVVRKMKSGRFCFKCGSKRSFGKNNFFRGSKVCKSCKNAELHTQSCVRLGRRGVRFCK